MIKILVKNVFMIVCLGISGDIAYGQTTVEINNTPNTFNGNCGLGTSNYAASEAIYTETEIRAGNFTTPATAITAFGLNVYQVGSTGITQFNTVKIYMMDVPLSTTTFSGGEYSTSGYTLVFSGSVMLSETGFTDITLTTPYVRATGTNLQVLIERQDGVNHGNYLYVVAKGNSANTSANSIRRYNGSSLNPYLGQSSFRAAGRLTNSGPLPIRLASIEAQHTGQGNQVTWKTASEDPGDYFELERSADGKMFTFLSEIAGTGKASSYIYEDKDPFDAENFYRLKLVDKEGAYVYSTIVKATTGKNAAFAIHAYPNPARNAVKFVYENNTLQDNTELKIRLMDLHGRLILQKDMPVTQGKNEIMLNVSGIAAGSYYLNYSNDSNGIRGSLRIVKE